MNKKVEYEIQYFGQKRWRISVMNYEHQSLKQLKKVKKEYPLNLKTRIIKRTITEEVIE